MAKSEEVRGRGIAEVVGRIKGAISSGRYGSGRFLPPVRKLSAVHRVSPETVRRGLKVLEEEGLLVAEARQGFRVVVRSGGEEERHCPIAYVTDFGDNLANAQPANWALMAALQRATAQSGATVLGAHAQGAGAAAIIERLKAGRAWGIALDTMDQKLLEALRPSGLPMVLVNSAWEGAEVDIVLQDNYRGGYLAARHLIESGCRRIAWFGAVGQYYHSRERYAGAVAALVAEGRKFEDSLCLDSEGHDPVSRAVELLSRADRPDGILAFSPKSMPALVQAGRQLGLAAEAAPKAIGWVVEDCYASEYLPIFAGAPAAPAVVWKASSMAERAMALLAERRAGAAGEPVRVCVPTRLKFADRTN